MSIFGTVFSLYILKGEHTTKYFINCHSLEDLKAEYRRLVKLHHPDLGGDTETMKAINDEHDQVFEILKKQHNASADEYNQTTETAEEFRTLINELLKLSGNTKEHKEALKALGCR